MLTYAPGRAALPLSTRPIPVWAAQSMGGGSVTATEAIADARAFDVITAHAGNYQPFVSAMKRANPRLTLLVYLNGTFGGKDPKRFPGWWYMRDANGNQTRSTNYRNYLMDFTRPVWIDHIRRACADAIDASGYDGCYVDMLGAAPLKPAYLTSLPINRTTGKVWTVGEWYQGTSALAAEIKEWVTPDLVLANGLRLGADYFNPAGPASGLLTGIDGGSAEMWLRLPRDPLTLHRTEAEWKQDVGMLSDAGSKGKSVLAMVKIWANGTQAQKDAWHEYALASFLLGNDGRSFFTFSYSESSDPTVPLPWWNTALGTPSGGYAKVANVYQRSFARGRVLVNPTSSTYRVQLGASYRNLLGNIVTSVTLGPWTGRVLTAV
jgi:hypothetical protein